MIRRFKKLFENDADGKERNWRTMEEQQIREEHQRCKTLTEDIYPELKYVKLPRFVGFDEDITNDDSMML